jgi:hypothetical protein
MRKIVIAAALGVLAATSFAPPSEAHRRYGCYSSAESASYEVWPPLSLNGGQTVIGRHPCGRPLRCWAATVYRDRAEIRRCTWLG